MADRLQKILSSAGVASRRVAERLIVEGRVSVNGDVVRELGTKAEPGVDDIRVDGRRLRLAATHRYILLNKPRNVMTTRADPEGRRTVLDLLHGVREYVYPVGRLDYDSEGLLVLTNDGDLAARLSHPRYGVEKTYHASVRGVPDRSALDALARGVTLDGRRTAPARVRVVRTFGSRGHEGATIELVLHEGRNRQVRRMCEAVGHPVDGLRRVRYGPLADESLPPGRWRDLTSREVAALQQAGVADASSRLSRAEASPRSGRPRRQPRIS